MPSEAKDSRLSTRIDRRTKNRIRKLRKANGNIGEATLVNILIDFALPLAEQGKITLRGSSTAAAVVP